MRQHQPTPHPEHDPSTVGTLSRRTLLRLLGALGVAAGAGPIVGTRLPHPEVAAAPPALAPSPDPAAPQPNAHVSVGQSERFRAILDRAGSEARRLRHPAVGTEHLLLALQRDYVTSRVLIESDPPLGRLRLTAEIRALAPPGNTLVAQPQLSPLAARAVALAGEEAGRLNFRFAEPEHLLLGLLRAPDGVAATILTRQQVTIDTARARMAAITAGDL